MQKRIEIVLLGVFVCSSLSGCGQSKGTIELGTETEKDISIIRKRQEEFPAAHSFEDGAMLAEFYTDDALLIPPDEPIVSGKQSITEWYECQFKKAAPIENPTVTIEQIEVFGNLAFNRGNFILKFKGETADKPVILNLRFITICQKQPDGNWKFYRDIWNTCDSPPPKEQSIPSKERSMSKDVIPLNVATVCMDVKTDTTVNIKTFTKYIEQAS